MIISKTPFRVSLFGGSTDYKSYYSLYGSLLIGFTVAQYCHIGVRRTPEIQPHYTKIIYSIMETVEKNSDIKHNGIRGCLEHLCPLDKLEIIHFSDLPAQTGIGSSSSFVVGLLNCLYRLNEHIPTKKQLAEDAIYVERELLQEPGGIQDQIWAAYGGFNSIHIDIDGNFTVKPMPISEEFIKEFFNRAILIYTGKNRESFKLAADHNKVNDSKKEIHLLAREAYNIFQKEGLSEIGILLHESWMRKKSITSNITNSHIDEMYYSLQKDGMIGGKLLGAGDSGFIFGLLRDSSIKEDLMKKYHKYYIECKPSFNGSEILNV